MSNSVSTVNNDMFAKKARQQDLARQGRLTTLSPGQQQFDTGTMNLLNEARGVVENAIGQGQELNPEIYKMLGLNPTYEDHSADLEASRGEMEAAQKQVDEANKQIGTIKAIPGKQRTPQQKKQLKQLRSNINGLSSALEKSKDAFGRLQTMPKTITGFEKLDPSAIPAESPFSGQNPLYQAQQAEAGRLNAYLSGTQEVDPTMKHQYDQAESALRAKLEQRYGPDYENTSVGQMALQNFMQTKNNAFATWNEQQVTKYNNLAFQGQANLQNLLSNRIAMMREPGQAATEMGNELSNLAGQRMTEQEQQMNYQLRRAGLAGTPTPIAGSAIGAAASGGGQLLGRLLSPNVGATGQMDAPSYASQLSNWISSPSGTTMANSPTANAAKGIDFGGGSLADWASTGGAGAGVGAAVGPSMAEESALWG